MKQALPKWAVLALSRAVRQRLALLLQPINFLRPRCRPLLWAGLIGSCSILASGCSGPPVQSEAKLMQKLAGTWHLDKLAAANLPLLTPIGNSKPAFTGILTHTHQPAAKPSRLTSVDLIFRPDGQVYAIATGAHPVAMDYEIDVTQDPPQLILYTPDRGIYNAEFSWVGDNELQFSGGLPRPLLRQPVSLQRKSYATDLPVSVAPVVPATPAAPDWEDPDEQARRWRRRRPHAPPRPNTRPVLALADSGLGRTDLNRLLQAQVAYFQSHQRFADRLEDLPNPNTLHFDQYRYQIQPSSTSQQVILTAQARQAHLPSFSGMVSFASTSSQVNPMPNTILCGTIEPSALPPSLSVGMPKTREISCPIGSIKM